MKETLDVCASVAQIVTAVIAGAVWIWYQNGLRRKRKRLEDYLKKGKGPGKTPQHTILHLMDGLGLTEAEIFQASFKSPHIRRLLTADDRGFPNRILFEYEENANLG